MDNNDILLAEHLARKINKRKTNIIKDHLNNYDPQKESLQKVLAFEKIIEQIIIKNRFAK